MKLTLASNNRAFSRTQWLLIICLSVVAFDFGARYAEHKFSIVSKPKSTNEVVVVTNISLTTAASEEPVTNLPDTNNVTYRVWNAPPTNKYVAPARGVRGPIGQPEIIEMASRGPRKKLPAPRTNAIPFGIRIAIP